jgi:FAD dependent oxidoreductase
MQKPISILALSIISLPTLMPLAGANPPRLPDQDVTCQLLIVGGGLAGVATAYEGLLAGKTVCLTEITDEKTTQRQRLFFPRGYLRLREKIQEKYGKLNPGKCWVSEACFLPKDGHKMLGEILKEAEQKGRGKLKWFPNTVIKELNINSSQIQNAIAIQHQPVKGTPPINTETLSQVINDAYTYENSARFEKKIIKFSPLKTDTKSGKPADWYVIEATETGELIGLADVPYKLGIDQRSYLEPSSASSTDDPYCTQGFTYTFAMEKTKEPQTHKLPSFYQQYAPYYSYELPRLASFPLVFTYRRIWSPNSNKISEFGGIRFTEPVPGDISMQNWTWGNDYRPGTAQDNLIYTREQLQATGQLSPGGWMGGLRQETLRKGEELSQAYFYWIVAGTTDSQLGEGVKKPYPDHSYLSGLNSPMGTVHGLSKYPYIREARRIIGRPSLGYPQGFIINETDISKRNYRHEYYQKNLPPEMYNQLLISLAGLEQIEAIQGKLPIDKIKQRSRSTVYADSVGIGHYPIDFHPCMQFSPAEAPGNKEKEGERQGGGSSYPFQIPLRAMIPQKIDNMIVAGKSIAGSHIAVAAYRVHSFEWSVGSAAAKTAIFAMDKAILPYQLTDNLPKDEPLLKELRTAIESSGNPTFFPKTSIFNQSWEQWK